MHPLLERALLSWAAGIVATTTIVTTAKNPNKKKKRRKKGKKKKGGDGIAVSKDEAIPRSTGAQAAHDYRIGHERGMTPQELLENVKGLGGKAKRTGAYLAKGLFGMTDAQGQQKAKAAPEEQKDGAAPQDAAAKKPDEIKPKPRRKDEPEPDVFTSIREEAQRALRDKVVGDAADKAGVQGAVENIKEQGEHLKDRAGKVFQGIKDAIPEDADEKVKAAGAKIADAGKKAGAAIKDAVSEEKLDQLGKKLDRGFKNIGRWFQGPGAPKDDDDAPAGREGPDVEPEEPPIDAKDADDEKRGKRRDGDDPDVVDARID